MNSLEKTTEAIKLEKSQSLDDLVEKSWIYVEGIEDRIKLVKAELRRKLDSQEPIDTKLEIEKIKFDLEKIGSIQQEITSKFLEIAPQHEADKSNVSIMLQIPRLEKVGSASLFIIAELEHIADRFRGIELNKIWL